jgi:hypothetical protein
MSIVERVEKEIAHSLLWNEETGTEHGASVPLSDLRALLALARACEAIKVFVDAAKAGLPKYRDEEDALERSYHSALAAVTRGEG